MSDIIKVALFCTGGNGGVCGAVVREFYTLVKEEAHKRNLPLVPYGARGGLSRYTESPERWLLELTEENTREDASPYEPAIVSFGTTGPSGKLENWRTQTANLHSFGVRHEMHWGGNYSLWSAAKKQEAIEQMGLQGQHFYCGVPKSIDNDYPGLSAGATTIGFLPAARAAASVSTRLCRDAKRSDNYITIQRLAGNGVGWLCERAARFAKMPFYLVPEQFKEPVPLSVLQDIIIAAYLKGAFTVGRRHLVPMIAEGISKCIDLNSSPELAEAIDAVRGDKGGFHPKDVELQSFLKRGIEDSLSEIEISEEIPCSPKVRYETTCYSPRGAQADDAERQKIRLLFGNALQHMLSGNSGFYVRENGTFSDLAEAGETENVHEDVRYLDMQDGDIRAFWNSGRGIRLVSGDLDDSNSINHLGRTLIQAMSETLRISPQELRRRFAPVIEWGEQFSN
jgi:6-phosphofructokinase